MFKINKEFRTDGVSLRVQAWIPFLYAKHLIDEAIKFPLALSENSKLAFVEEAYVPVGFQKRFSNRRVFMFSNTLGGVGLCSRHNLHRTDHMKINKPRIVDVRLEA